LGRSAYWSFGGGEFGHRFRRKKRTTFREWYNVTTIPAGPVKKILEEVKGQAEGDLKDLLKRLQARKVDVFAWKVAFGKGYSIATLLYDNTSNSFLMTYDGVVGTTVIAPGTAAAEVTGDGDLERFKFVFTGEFDPTSDTVTSTSALTWIIPK
jgi:hypothetical protein